ncbi:hypothetical protein [Benzoatithermus flavus]|uniref:SlyX protein n=1 Tax=Benzoatithermus flavus TaxID=3108223 RepID=A0ABU8XPR9_9PROT
MDNFKTVMLIHERLRALNDRADALGRAVDQIDRRLVRVETVLEFATEGRFRPRLTRPGDHPSER